MSERESSIAHKVSVLVKESLLRSSIADHVVNDKEEGSLVRLTFALQGQGTDQWILTVSEMSEDKCLVTITDQKDTVLVSKIVSYSELVSKQANGREPEQFTPLDWTHIRGQVLTQLGMTDRVPTGTATTTTTEPEPTRASDMRQKGVTRPGDMPQFDDEYEVSRQNNPLGPLPGINLPSGRRSGYGDTDLYPLGQRGIFTGPNIGPNIGTGTGKGNGMIFPLQRDDPNQQEGNRGPDFMPGAKYDPPFGQGPSFGQGGSSFPPL